MGYFPELLHLFPEEPEIFHSKQHNVDNEQIGPFGAAENANHELRSITEQEAEEVGLLSGEYRQVLIDEEFETFVAGRLASLGEPEEG